MNQKFWCHVNKVFISLIFGILHLTAFHVAADLTAEGHPFTEDIAPYEHPVSPNLDFRRWPDNGFVESVTSRVDALASAHAADRSAVMLDLAEIYLAQMLTSEAESFIEAVPIPDRTGSDRYFALRDAVDLLRGRPVDDFEASPLIAREREDAALWRSLFALATSENEMLRSNLEGALIALSQQSRPVAIALLPLIAEAAIGLEDMVLASTSLDLIATVPELAQSSSAQYLRGRHQETLGNEKSALDEYFTASQAWDRYAARARIALADLAMQDGSVGALLAARDVLSAGAGAWRDDDTEIAALQRQAKVSGLLNEPIVALMAYRRILTRFPDSPEATEATRSAVKQLEKVYQGGRDGQMTFSNWFELHQVLLPTYRFFPQFPRFNELLADHVFEMGGMDLAISEYRQILSIYDEWPTMLGYPARTDDLNRITLKLARAQLRAGLWQDGLVSLETMQPPLDRGFENEINKLRVKAMTELGDVEGLLRTAVSTPDAESLRNRGMALFVRQNWFGASDHYERLWQTFPQEFRLSDASYLLIAAYRVENRELAQRVVQAFPQLTESEDIAGLAAGLLQEPSPLQPLRDASANERLESAGDTMRLIQNSGVFP